MEAVLQSVLPSKKKVIPIVPYRVKGRYRNIKTAILLLAFTVYFSLPWVTWHGDKRVGQPILFDLATLRVNFFDLVIFPQDLIILVGMLIIAVVLLFIAASLYGRMFCGFFCFQTVWTDAFRFIEFMVQGEAQARLRLSKQKWSLQKMAKLGLTHVLWLLLSFATALTFALYFLEAPVLFAQIFQGTAPAAAYITVAALTATTYVAAGIAREQVCLVACPYGKFQTVMQDASTKTVIYDSERGERTLGRTAPKADLKPATLRVEKGYGDCIDCNYCVNVCPTGVDIRKGFQIDCISCGLCVDACNTIMDKLGLARNLIRFDQMQSESNNASKFNIRTFGYSAVLAATLAFVVHTANNLAPFEATAQHHAQPLFTMMANGDIKNQYILRITNKSTQPTDYILRLEGLPQHALSRFKEIQVPAGKTYTQVFDVKLPSATARKTREFKVVLLQKKDAESSKSFLLTFHSGI